MKKIWIHRSLLCNLFRQRTSQSVLEFILDMARNQAVEELETLTDKLLSLPESEWEMVLV